MSLQQTLPLLSVVVLILAGSNIFYSSLQQELSQLREEQILILNQVTATTRSDSHYSRNKQQQERLNDGGGDPTEKANTDALEKMVLQLQSENKELSKEMKTFQEDQKRHHEGLDQQLASLKKERAETEQRQNSIREDPIDSTNQGVKAGHRANGTVVTAYFEVPSKHSIGEYTKWMSFMLSIDDPVIVFTTPDWVDRIKELRQHATNRTLVIPVQLDDLPMATSYKASVWKHQFDKLDPIRRFRKSYKLYWIWLSKSHFVNEAIKLNPFQSTHFMWSDIGCYRFANLKDTFGNQTIVKHLERIPDESVLLMSHQKPKPPTDLWFSSPDGGSSNFYTSGSSFACRKEICVKFHKYFLQTIQGYFDRKLFVGEDQIILQSTCLQHPDICRYVLHEQVKPSDSSYFALRSVLHFGGDHYKYWAPPPLLSNQSSL